MTKISILVLKVIPDGSGRPGENGRVRGASGSGRGGGTRETQDR